MPDMLVNLHGLAAAPALPGVTLRRALAAERRPVVGWVEARFGPGWAGECETGFAATPTRCLIALRAGVMAGFALWDVTARGFFGPIGVDDGARGGGIGAALLLGVLAAMRGDGYGYAIIGDAGVPDFFARVAGAIPIPGSSLYAGLLKNR